MSEIRLETTRKPGEKYPDMANRLREEAREVMAGMTTENMVWAKSPSWQETEHGLSLAWPYKIKP